MLQKKHFLATALFLSFGIWQSVSPDDLPWVGPRSNATATVGTQVYSYKILEPLDVVTADGRLSMVDATNGIKWAYNDHQTIQYGVGQWHWRVGDTHKWDYDVVSDTWSYQGSDHKWERTGAYGWLNRKREESWDFLPFTSTDGFNDIWEHRTIGGGTHQWGMNPTTQIWKNIDRSIFWTFDQANMRWLQTGDASGNIWDYNPKLETWSYTGPGATDNRWKLIADTLWVEEYTGEEWLFSSGGTHGRWKKNGTEVYWGYNTGTHKWDEEGTANTKHFPPLLPSPVVHQMNSIWIASNGSVNGSAFDEPDTTGPNVWTDGTNTLTVDSSPASAGYKMELGSLGVDVGRSSNYGFSGSAQWQSTGGQRWDSGGGGGETSSYINNSTGIAASAKDTIIRNNVENTWWREDFENHVWVYHASTDKWHNKSMDEWFTYDFEALTWTLDDSSSSWQYIDNGGNDWLWNNVGTSEKWRYVNGTPNRWTEVSSGHLWSASGDNLFNISTAETWHYVKANNLWYKDGDTGTTGKDLFPQLMPDLVGYAGALVKIALTETVSTSPRHSALGFIGRMNARRTEYEALQAKFDAAIANDRGILRYNKMLPMQTEAQLLAHGNQQLAYDFSGVYNMYTQNNNYIPSDDTFSVWNPTYWRFISAGKGSVLYSYAADKSLKIGLSATPSTDGSADFTIVIDPTVSVAFSEGPPETPVHRYAYDSCNVKVYQGETLLTDTALSVFPAKYDGGAIPMGSTSIWLSFNNGKITMGREDPTTKYLIPNAFDIFFEYQITDTTTAATMQYHSVSHLTEKPQTDAGIGVRSQQFAYFDTQARSVDLWNQTADQVQFSKIDEELIRAKADLLAIATTDTTHRERLDRIITKDLGNTFAALAVIYSSYRDAGYSEDGYLSAASKPYLDSLFNTATYAAAIAGVGTGDGLQLYFGISVPALEQGLDSILNTDASTLLDENGNLDLGDPGDGVGKPGAVVVVPTGVFGLRAGLFAKASMLTSFLSGSLLTAIGNLIATPGNDDLLPFSNFLQEEIGLIQSVNTIMNDMQTILFRRLYAQANLYQTDPAAAANAAANLLAAEAQDNEEKELIIDSLATQLSSGSKNLFAVIAAPAMVIAFGSTFDEVRRRTHKFLADRGEVDFHTNPPVGHPLRDYATARAKVTEIVNEVETLLKQSGNQFYEAFKGDVFATIEPPEDVIVEEEVNASTTLTDQEKTVAPGTSTTYRKNINVKTADGDATESVVREVKIDATDKVAAPARVFVKDALLSLGNGNFSKDAGKSLSVLGAAQITPDGNARIELNSDILILGSDALAPTKNFGDDATTATRCIGELPLAQLGQHEIVFHSDVERTITVGRDVDFNLTGFGKGRTSGGQRITFSGKVKLVMEPGSRLRLPYIHPDKRDYGLIVGFKDQAELVFQGTEDRDEPRWSDALTGSDKVRSKILGTATLEFADEAKMKIMRTALVGVEADYTSNITDIKLHLKDSAQVLIGSDSIAGGAFQVGNVVEGGRNHLKPDNYPNTNAHPLFGDTETPFEPRKAHVDFTLTLDGRNALFYLGREAFCGFGVGTVNKKGNPNGTTPDAATDPATDADQFNAWRVQSLHNTGNITIDIANGTFSHHQVALGDSKEAAVLAFGPQVSRANYKLKVTTKRGDAIKGGGNVMILRSGVAEDSPLPLRVWDNVDDLTGGTADSGKSSILAPATVLARRVETNTDGEKVYKRAAVKTDSNSYQITGPIDEVFLASTMQDLETDGREAIASTDQTENKVSFVKNKKITVQTVLNEDVKDSKGNTANPSTSTEKGYVKARDAEDVPQTWTKPTK